MKTRKFIAIITAVIMLLSVGTMNAFAVETYSSNVLTPQDVTAYEDILDRLNDEYGYSMYFSPEIFTRGSKFENPTKYSLSEFEASIKAEPRKAPTQGVRLTEYMIPKRKAPKALSTFFMLPIPLKNGRLKTSR